MAKSYKLGQLGKFRESYYDLGEVLYGSGDIEVPIPDKSAEGAIHKIYVNDNYTIEALQLYISSDHQAPKDLGVELISPQGTRSVLMTINSNITQGQLEENVLLTNAFYGESSKGEWTIKVIDGAKGRGSNSNDVGSLTKWEMNIFGRLK